MDTAPTDQASLNTGVAAPSVTFESLTFSDGTTIPLDPADIVVFVGPNNAGKSLALRELEKHIGPATTGVVIKGATLRRTGTVEQLQAFLERYGQKIGTPSERQYMGFRYTVPARKLPGYWTGNLEALRPFFCMRVPTETRITDSNPQGAIAILEHQPQHPIHVLYIDDELERRISGYFKRAFGKELIVFHAGGASWPLLVGERPKLEAGDNAYSAKYNERLRASAEQLQSQGDGMRSFATVILFLLAPITPSVLLLDEPEAFLHPPQARLLGEFALR